MFTLDIARKTAVNCKDLFPVMGSTVSNLNTTWFISVGLISVC